MTASRSRAGQRAWMYTIIRSRDWGNNEVFLSGSLFSSIYVIRFVRITHRRRTPYNNVIENLQ